MSSLTCGAAIITYNGLKYLPAQLESMLAQSRALNHIVISDDRSTDGTWEYLEAWSKQAPIRVTLIRNERQLGMSANYQQAIASVQTDIIFTADQDDVWLPNKVDMQAAILEASPELLLVHSDAFLVDANGKSLGKTLFESLEIGTKELRTINSGNAFSVYLKRNLATGATFALRKELLDLALPIPDHKDTYFIHDHWLALLAAAKNRIHILTSQTIEYRQHGGNTIGVNLDQSIAMRMRQLYWNLNSNKTLAFNHERHVTRHSALRTRLSSHSKVPPQHLETVETALKFSKRRMDMPGSSLPRTAAVVRNMLTGRYHRFCSEPWSEILRDLTNR